MVPSLDHAIVELFSELPNQNNFCKVLSTNYFHSKNLRLNYLHSKEPVDILILDTESCQNLVCLPLRNLIFVFTTKSHHKLDICFQRPKP
uniref:Putative ovule protein n=1 Tax=Solanum chacoense TaxID=4108 RepID=A0A0V0H1C9_SOLCH